jgi:hypothetical protein
MASVWICSCHYTSIPQSRWRLMICSVRRLHSIVAQGSALSPLIFLLFMNALLGLLTDRGQKPRISHGLKCGVQLRRKEATSATEHAESVSFCFVDDLSLFAQTLGGAQALLEAIQEFGLWCGLKVNRKKTCAMVVERRGTGQHQMDETLVYMGREVTFLAPSTACRYLGVWGTPTGEISNTKRESSRELRRRGIYFDVITPSHLNRRLISSRVLALERLDIRVRWCHGQKRSYNGLRLCGSKHINGRGACQGPRHPTCSPCRPALRDLNLACEQWACDSLQEFTEAMEMWKWDSTLNNKWARVAKCSQLLSIPVEMPGAQEDLVGEAKTSGWLECGTWIRSNGIYYGLESRPSGRRYPISLLQGTHRRASGT